MIRLAGVSWHQAGRDLLRGLDLSLDTGCIAVIGANGAGKSTLLQLCADGGRQRAEGRLEGRLELDGKPLRDWGPALLARRRACLPQHHADAIALPVFHLLGLATWPWGGGPLPAERLEEAAARWDLAGLMPRSYSSLSGGERQRVQLARTWLQLRLQPDPAQRLWLLDEPQTALDLPHQQALLACLATEAAAGALVMFSTHDINFALRTADRILVLKEGRLVADDAPAGLADPRRLQDIYGVPFVRLTHPGDGRPLLLPG